jgi:hypothetical protein
MEARGCSMHSSQISRSGQERKVPFTRDCSRQLQLEQENGGASGISTSIITFGSCFSSELISPPIPAAERRPGPEASCVELFNVREWREQGKMSKNLYFPWLCA